MTPDLPGAFTARLERAIFGHRVLIIVLFALVTVAMLFVAWRGLRIDAAFTKQLPVRHEYMRTYLDEKVGEFRGANRVLIALVARDGNMFTPQFFEALRKATDEVIVMDGIDRGRVQSLFTPNVRYLEVVEDGIEAGNVIPAEFQPTAEGLAQVRENILKAGIVGRLVANDFSGALVSGIVLEEDANGKPVNPIAVAREIETKVRNAIQQSSGGAIDVHIIGFAKVMDDIASGATSVAVFAAITLLLTLLSVWAYCQSFHVALVPKV
jgi:predicted RND superfamily exporter protein